MADPVDLCRNILAGASGVTAIVGQRIYRADAVPSQALRPLLQLTLISAVPDIDVDGTVDDVAVTIQIEAVADATPAGAVAVPAIIVAIGNIGALTLAVTDTGDEPSGPVDSMSKTAFIRSGTVQFTY